MKPFQDPNAIPTTVVYEKKAGFTASDFVEMKDQAAQLQKMDDVEGKVIGPIPSKDGQAAQTVVTYNLGSDGWNKMPDIGKDIHKIAKIDGGTVLLAGIGRTGDRLLRGVRRPRQHLARSPHCSSSSCCC